MCYIIRRGFDSMDFWSDVLERIRWKIPKVSYDMWFSRTEVELDGDVLIVKVENQFSKDWLNSRYKKIIALSVYETLGKKYKIQIETKDRPKGKENPISKTISQNPYDEIKNFIAQQNITIKNLQQKINELEKKVVLLEEVDRIM